MKWLGEKDVKLSALKLPGDFAKRLGARSVKELEESFEHTGGRPIHLPVVEKKTMTVVSGCDRIAALKLRDAKTVRVSLWEGTADERDDVALQENLARRHDNKDELRQAFEAKHRKLTKGGVSRQVSKNPPAAEPEKRGPGRPESKRRQAIKETAKEAGVSERTVERAVAPEPKLEPPKPVIDCLGVQVEQSVLDDAAAAEASLVLAHQALVRAQTLIEQARPHLQVPIYQRAKQDAHSSADYITKARPASVCPLCKAAPTLRADCNCCRGKGWVTKETAEATPKELRDASAPKVSQKGKAVPAERHGVKRQMTIIVEPDDANKNAALMERIRGFCDRRDTCVGCVLLGAVSDGVESCILSTDPTSAEVLKLLDGAGPDGQKTEPPVRELTVEPDDAPPSDDDLAF